MTRRFIAGPCVRMITLLVIIVFTMVCAVSRAEPGVFKGEVFTDHDSLLVVDQNGQEVYAWRENTPRVPASIMKLITAWLALDKWGAEYRFTTNFYVDGHTLWVKGAGDPMLVSEELDLLAESLNKVLPDKLQAIGLDTSLFADVPIPGRGVTNDPYNAPMSALAVNFNTVSVRRVGNVLQSGEPQTPLTQTAQKLVKQRAVKLANKPERINLRNAELAQQQFAEILLAKLRRSEISQVKRGTVPASAKLVYRHSNSNTLSTVLRGSLEYSNNFIANQLFLLLPSNGKEKSLDLPRAQEYAAKRLAELTSWQNPRVYEGAGLSRSNRFSAVQIIQVLDELAPQSGLLKSYPLKSPKAGGAIAYAKSGTLDGVHTLAGYLHQGIEKYQFVFMFNRKMPYRYRETLLQKLADQLRQQRAN